MISRDEILKGQECPPELEANLQALLVALNLFRNVYGCPMIVTSGLRSAAHNASVGGKPNSAHETAEAADFHDPDDQLKNFCYSNVSLLESCGLWMEDCHYQPAGDSHVHFQIRPVPSGHRIFIP